tara:strand:+ start:2218 stop:5985 length:3768 start_codon:yes stop_codon:yes gene_type:complete
MSLEGSLKLQLDITNKLVQSMNKVLTSIEKSNNISSSQTSIINGINESFSETNKSLETSADNLNDVNRTLDKALKQSDPQKSENKYIEMLNEFRKYEREGRASVYLFKRPVEDMKNKIFNFGSTLVSKLKNSKLVIKVKRSFLKIKSDFEDFQKAVKASNGVLETTATILKGVKEVLNTVVGGVATLGSGFVIKIITSLISGVVNVLKSATGIVTKFFKLTLSLPFQIAEAAASLGGKIRKEIVETFYQAREDAKKDFDLNSSIGEGVKKLTSITIGSLKEFEYANSNLTKLFGHGSQGAAQMMKFTLENVSAMGHFSELFGSSIMKNKDSIEFLARAQKSMNMSTEDIGYMALVAASNGESIYTAIDRVRESLQVISLKSGVDFKRLSTNFFKLRKNIVEFGHLSDIELSKTVSKITQLGVKTDDVVNVFKQFGTFESAASSAAQLYQTFGMNIDAFTLISERDPAKIIDMFRQGMYETGKTFSDLNRHEKALMTQFTGLSAESLKSVMNFRNMNLSYKELKEKMKEEDVTEKQIKAIDSLKSSITQLQKTMQFKSPFESFFKGLAQTIAYDDEMYKEVMELSNINQSIFDFALSIDKKTLRKLTAPIIDVIRVMKSVFSSKGFKKALKGGLKALSELTLGVTKSVFSPKFMKDIDDLSVKFSATSIDIFKSKNNDLYKIISGSFGDKKTGKLIRKALKKSGVSMKKLSKMTTEEMINAVKKAAYSVSSDPKSRDAMIALTKKINDSYKTEFGTEKVKKAVIKNNNPIEAVNKFVTKVSKLLGENEDLGKRILDISGTLMGQIIKGTAVGGVTAAKEIAKAMKEGEKLNDKEIEKKAANLTGLKDFDWKALKNAYDAEFIKINKNNKVFKKFGKIAARSFKGIGKEIGNILVKMLESVYFSVLASNSTVGKMLMLTASDGFLSAVGLKTMKGAAEDEYGKLGEDKSISKSKYARLSKAFVGESDIGNAQKMATLANLSTSFPVQGKLLANRSLFEIAKNSIKEYESKNIKNEHLKKLFKYYTSALGDKVFEAYSRGKSQTKLIDMAPENHYQILLKMFNIAKSVAKNKDKPDHKKKEIEQMLKGLQARNKPDTKVDKYLDFISNLSPGYILSDLIWNKVTKPNERDLGKMYREQIIQDGNFTNIDSSSMRIISNGTVYIPSEQDQGEFIVWKKDGAIYNMFDSIKKEFDQEINSVEVSPVKISMSNREKKASNKQIKEIISKLRVFNEKLKNRKIKVNHKVNSDNEELSNVIVS